MAEGTLRQLDEIEKSAAGPGEKSRAKMLLLIQAATMTGLTALQFKGMGPLGRGETLVLAPGPDGLPVISPAVRANTVIVDANIAIALRKRARIAALKPGETLRPREALQAGEVVAGGYLLREPAPGEPVVLLHQWTCPACGYAYNWAEVVVTDGIITSIRAVDLNRAALAHAHFIVDDARDIAADLAGVRSSLDLDSDQVVQILRERVPTAGGWRLVPDT